MNFLKADRQVFLDTYIFKVIEVDGDLRGAYQRNSFSTIQTGIRNWTCDEILGFQSSENLFLIFSDRPEAYFVKKTSNFFRLGFIFLLLNEVNNCNVAKSCFHFVALSNWVNDTELPKLLDFKILIYLN